MLNDILISVALGVVGLCLGAFINWAIYNWAIINPRLISPWGDQPDQTEARTLIDRIPVIGWWQLKRESKIHGKGFWVRPMLVELLACALMVWLYWWITNGHLVENDKLFGSVLWSESFTRYAVFSFVIMLMAIATFIDFDEKIIPDMVTVPGTLIGLVLAASFPAAKLPIIQKELQFGFLQNAQKNAKTWLDSINFASPGELPEWTFEWVALVGGIACLAGWCFALTPKTIYWRQGVINGLKYACASILRPARKTNPKIDCPRRTIYPQTWFLLTTAIVGAGFIAFIWQFGGDHWESLYTSLLGMAFGGGLVWLIRIVASYSLGQEALGFGDVTLMAMLGVYFGWQASLLIFVFAPFAAIAIALAQYIITRKHDIAFGPYLCVSALVLLIYWPAIWNDWAGPRVFSLGPLLLWVLGGSLVLMVIMLGGLRLMRGGGDD